MVECASLKARWAQVASPWRTPAVRRIAGNFGWLVAEKGLTLLLSLVVSVWMARYLGPELFGLLNYTVAFVALFGSFTYFGVSGIAVRDLVERPGDRDELLGTVFVLRLLGAFFAIGMIGLFVWFGFDDRRERWIIAVLSAGMLFQSVSVISFWYQSRIEDKYVVRASAFAALAAATANILLILAKAPVIAFVAVIVAQHALNSIGLLYIYRSHGLAVTRWRFRFNRARTLLHQSWPLMLAAIGAMLYLKIDQVMIRHISGNEEVGIYAVAVKFSEIWYFIPIALAASLFPKMVQFRILTRDQYDERMQRIYRIVVLAAYGIALPVTLTAGTVIGTLYGPDYQAAANVLMIHIWACPTVFMGAVLSKWLISEGLLLFSLTRHGFGALANIGLNLVLIPHYGALGAAVATVASYSVASYLACFSDRRTFAMGMMMTRALFMPFKELIPNPIARS